MFVVQAVDRDSNIIGSSGVGKSTLLNNLLGKNEMRTDSISQSTNKERHVTSHRELFILENGGILIDNPGMREVGIAERRIKDKEFGKMVKNIKKDLKKNNY